MTYQVAPNATYGRVVVHDGASVQFVGSLNEVLIEFSGRDDDDRAPALVQHLLHVGFPDSAQRARVRERVSSIVGELQRSRQLHRQPGKPLNTHLTAWTAEPTGDDVAYMLRRSMPDGTSYNGFKWPQSGYVTPREFDATDLPRIDSAGNDHSKLLFGMLNGRGALGQAPQYIASAMWWQEGPFRLDQALARREPSRPDAFDDGYSWQVFTVSASEVVDTPGGTAAPRGWVRFHGTFWGAMLNMAVLHLTTGRGKGFVRNSLRSYAAAMLPKLPERALWVRKHEKRAMCEAEVAVDA